MHELSIYRRSVPTPHAVAGPFAAGWRPQAGHGGASPGVYFPANTHSRAGARTAAQKTRKRRAIFVMIIFSLIYFGFWRKGCVCPIGAIQNVALSFFDPGYAVPITITLFFLLPLIFTLFFARSFCAAVCPLGAIQDLVLLRPTSLPQWLESGLRLFAYVYLAAAVLFAATGSAFIICRYDPFVSFLRLNGSLNILILGACFLFIGMLE